MYEGFLIATSVNNVWIMQSLQLHFEFEKEVSWNTIIYCRINFYSEMQTSIRVCIKIGLPFLKSSYYFWLSPLESQHFEHWKSKICFVIWRQFFFNQHWLGSIRFWTLTLVFCSIFWHRLFLHPRLDLTLIASSSNFKLKLN